MGEFKQPMNKGVGKKRKMDSVDCGDDSTNSSKLHKENNSETSHEVTGTNAKRKNDRDGKLFYATIFFSFILKNFFIHFPFPSIQFS